MKRLLFVTTAFLALSAMSAEAAIIADLGINPTSGQGSFSNAVFGTAFDDQYTFTLVGGPQFLTVTSVTNVFPAETDFITGFTGSVFQVGNPVPIIGPVLAGSNCGLGCQGFSGSAILEAGEYFLDLSGQGGGTSGYGGDLSVAAVPEASTWCMMLLGFIGIAGIAGRKQWKGFRLA